MGKKSRRKRVAARREHQLAKRQQRMDNKSDRRDSRSERKDIRQQARTERTNTRQVNRTDRSSLRATTRQTAYENGMDPNAWIADSVGSVADATSDIFQAKFQAGRPSLAQAFGQNIGTPNQQSGGNNNMLLYGAIGLGAYMFLKR